jgi:hypothetical protein
LKVFYQKLPELKLCAAKIKVTIKKYSCKQANCAVLNAHADGLSQQLPTDIVQYTYFTIHV